MSYKNKFSDNKIDAPPIGKKCTGNNSQYLLEMKSISKRFGDIQALKNVNFEIGNNEIVGLIGDNGAGKSTLIKILTGVHLPDSGEIFHKGEKVNFNSPADAIRLRIEAVHQRGQLIGGMSIRENFFLGREITKSKFLGWLDVKKMDESCKEILEGLGINYKSTEQDIATLSGGQSQAVAIGRCIHFGGELLVLDEPTAALSLRETDKVLNYIVNAKKMGISIVLVSHLIRHVFDAADRFVILERGEKIGDFKKGEITRKKLEEIIVTGRVNRHEE